MKTNTMGNSKIFIRSLVIIFLLFTFTFLLIEQIVYRKMKDDAIKQILLHSEMTNIKISDVFNDTKIITDQLGTNNEIKDYIREVKSRQDIFSHPLNPRVLETLKNIKAVNNNIYLAWVANDAANFCLDSSEIITDASFNAELRPWHQPAQSSPGAAFSQPYYEYTTNTLAISCVKAIRENGTIIGYVSADISLARLPQIMQTFVIGKNGRSILLTDKGTAVFTYENPMNRELISVSTLTPYIGPLKNGESDYLEITLNNKDYFLTYQTIDINGWGILQLIDKDEMMEPFQNTMNLMLYIFLFGCLVSMMIVVINILDHRRIQSKLNLEATTDFLTGIQNRKYFLRHAEKIFITAKRNQQQLSLLMIDIDQFKGINDSHGHDIGDLVLKSTAAELAKILRGEDLFCRLGGDEFAILLQGAGPSVTQAIARRMIDGISQMSIASEKGPLSISISIGIACMDHHDPNFAFLLKRADQALYRAKNSGRNTFSL